MRDNFKACLAFTLGQEGGYVNNPRDPGGETNHGITQRTLMAWCKARGLHVGSVRNLTYTSVSQIYENMYWDTVHCDAYRAGVDLCMFEIAVMSGPHTASVLYQHGAHDIDTLCDAQFKFLQGLHTWGVFGKGWHARIEARRSVAKHMEQ